MNLIQDAWIPVRKKDGTVQMIAPWQVTEDNGEAYVELASPRPDFNGALIQFFIGLLQTTFAPETSKEWRQRLRQPPSPEELKEIFKPVEHAFNLDGEGPRFMQDLDLEVAKLEKIPISHLLIDSPGDQTNVNNKDHFVKRAQILKICPICATAGLLTLQVNAPAGGQGNRTGLRGGGPLTTIIWMDVLWKSIWFNILERDVYFSKSGNPDKKENKDRFPWLAKTRTSEGNKETTPEDVHPDQNFWAMPRRIRLDFSNNEKLIKCDICGREDKYSIREYVSKNYGTNYKGPWMHPLSPYFIDDKGIPGAIHPQPGGIGYRHWLGFVQSVTDKKGIKQPARVIDYFINNRRSDFRVRAFGYDMDNMKARCWYDTTMPLVLVDEDHRQIFEGYTASLILCARQVVSDTRYQLKKALFKPEHEVKGSLSFVDQRFWQETEADFFTHLAKLREALVSGGDVTPVLESWHKGIAKTAMQIFDDFSQNGSFDAADPKRIALAWRDLKKSLYGKKIREQLGLPDKPEKEVSV